MELGFRSGLRLGLGKVLLLVGVGWWQQLQRTAHAAEAPRAAWVGIGVRVRVRVRVSVGLGLGFRDSGEGEGEGVGSG